MKLRTGRLGDVLTRPLPSPPDVLRQGPFKADADRPERSPHDARTAALLGSAVGVTMLVCIVTGYISHLHQHPLSWFDMPSRPVWAYQLTQGLHVICGLALVPLVLAKLWVVYPRLFEWPPVRDLVHAAERLLIVPLVAAVLFELVSGMFNIVQWYPWGFFFPATHYAVAWVAAGAVLAHLAFKSPVLVANLGRNRVRPAGSGGSDVDGSGGPDVDDVAHRDRRAVLVGAGLAAGAVTIATAGQTFGPLSSISVLATRKRDLGPQGLPVNRTAAEAKVTELATAADWSLLVDGPKQVRLTMADLLGLPQHRATLPIACVEGWSATAEWAGVPIQTVLDLAGIPHDARVRVVSLEKGLYQSSPVGPREAGDELTLLALRVGGEPLHLEHGYPVRLIGPNRPGVQQTKWLQRIEVI